MLAVSLASLIFQASPDLGRKIDLVLKAMPASTCIRQLGVAANLPLAVDATMARETLVLRLDRCPLDQAMTQIARTLNATWKLERGTYTLGHSPTQLHQDEEWEFQQALDAILDDFKMRREAVAKQVTFDDTEANRLARQFRDYHDRTNNSDPAARTRLREALDRRTPISRAINQLLLTLDPAEIARLAPHRQLVFSNAPNRLQLPLPTAAKSILAKLATDQARWDRVQAAQKWAKDEQAASAEGEFDMSPRVRKILLKVMRDSGRPSFYFELVTVTDAKTISSAALEVLPSSAARRIQRTNPIEPAKVEGKVALSRESEVLLAPESEDREKAEKQRRAVQALARDPVAHDPLSFALSDGLISWAAARKMNLVASLPDDAYMINFLPRVADRDLRAFSRLCKGRLQVAENETWLTVRPRTPVTARSQYFGRTHLKSYLQSRFATPEPALLTRARLTAGLPDYLDVGDILTAILIRSDLSNGEDDDTNPLFRLIGLLDNGQLSLARREQGIPLGDLRSGQRRLLWLKLFDELDITKVLPEDGVDPREHGETVEPTELFERGFPPDSRLYIKGDEKEQVTVRLAVKGGEPDFETPIEPAEFGIFLLVLRRPDLLTPADGKVDQGPIPKMEFSVGRNTTLKVRLTFDAGAETESEFSGFTPGSLRNVPYEQLPEWFRTPAEKSFLDLVRERGG